MIAVVFAAVGFAALREPYSTFWASLVFTLTVLALTTATLGAILRRGPAWSGFALFGWGWLILAFGPWRGPESTPVPIPLSTLVLHHLANRVALAPGYAFTTMNDTHGFLRWDGKTSFRIPYAFLQTGNCLFSLAIGSMGGFLARVLAGGPVRIRDGDSASHDQRRLP